MDFAFAAYLAVTISWQYQADWEGEAPIAVTDVCRLFWAEVVALRDLDPIPPLHAG